VSRIGAGTGGAILEGVAGKGGCGINLDGIDGAVGDGGMFERRDRSGPRGPETVGWAKAGGVELPACGLGVGANSEGTRGGGAGREQACEEACYSESGDLEESAGSAVRPSRGHAGLQSNLFETQQPHGHLGLLRRIAVRGQGLNARCVI
jgi:hypothetical protein